MLAIVAVIIFAIAFIIRVTATTTDAVFALASLVILGLICVALHLAGLEPAGACAANGLPGPGPPPGRATRRRSRCSGGLAATAPAG